MKKMFVLGKSPASLVALVYTLGVLVIYPCICRGYADLSPFKFGTLITFSLICVFSLSFVFPEGQRIPKSPAAFSVVLLVVSAGLSVVVSPTPLSSLWGSEGYLGGFYQILLCAIGYFIVTTFFPAEWGTDLLYLFLCTGACVGVLGVLNAFGADPLGFATYLTPEMRHIFFSTIGNVDYLDSFFCLWIPLAIWWILRGKTTFQRITGSIFSGIGFVCLAALDPGIAALGICFAAFCAANFIPLCLRDIQRLMQLAGVWFLAQLFVVRLCDNHEILMLERPFIRMGQTTTALPAALLLWGIAAVLLLIPKEQRSVCKLQYQRIIVGMSVGGLAALFLWRNTTGHSLGALDNFFLLGPDWATGRGALLADGLQMFRLGNVAQKLFGHGMGTVHRAMTEYWQEMPYPLSDAFGLHNEYLELLVCCGVLGLLLWLVALGIHLIPALRSEEMNRVGIALCGCAYVGQAFFNNRVCSVFPVFFVLLGLLCPAKTSVKDVPPLSRKQLFLCLSLSILLFVLSIPAALLLFQPMFL